MMTQGIASAGWIALLLAALAVQIWLVGRNVRHLRRQRVGAGRIESGEAADAAVEYSIQRGRHLIAVLSVDALLVLLWTAAGGLVWLEEVSRGTGLPAFAAGMIVVVTAAGVTWAVRLGPAAVRLFVVEHGFGLERTGAAAFLADAAKRAGLGLAGLATFGSVALLLVQSPYWWIWIWVVWTAASLARTRIAPALARGVPGPARPLADPDLACRLSALAERCGTAPATILVVESSARSGHANARVEGLGRARRVILLDTLLEALAPDEVEAVVAHEFGHLAEHHEVKYWAFETSLGLAGLAAFAALLDAPWFSAALGAPAPSPAQVLVLLFAVAWLARAFTRPVRAALIRQFESRADAFAARQSDPAALSRAVAKLAGKNLTGTTSDPIYAAVFETYPPLEVRMDRLAALAAHRQ